MTPPTILLIIWYMLLTIPTLIYYGMISIISRKILVRYKNNENIIIDNNSDTTIVLVHGRNGSTYHFKSLIEKLKYQTNYNIVCVQLHNTGSTTIAEDATYLDSYLKTFNVDLSNLILVGLSKGGLVVSHFANCFANNHTNNYSIKKIITISSPLHGTKVANYSIDKCTRKELGYRSEQSEKLAKLVAGSGLNYYHIVPKYDHVIIPQTSAMYETTAPDNIYKYNGFNNHCAIVESSDVIDQIIQWINS